MSRASGLKGCAVKVVFLCIFLAFVLQFNHYWRHFWRLFDYCHTILIQFCNTVSSQIMRSCHVLNQADLLCFFLNSFAGICTEYQTRGILIWSRLGLCAAHLRTEVLVAWSLLVPTKISVLKRAQAHFSREPRYWQWVRSRIPFILEQWIFVIICIILVTLINIFNTIVIKYNDIDALNIQMSESACYSKYNKRCWRYSRRCFMRTVLFIIRVEIQQFSGFVNPL